MSDLDARDEYEAVFDDGEDEIEEAREEAFEEGVEEGQTRSFGCGCLFGVALTLVAINMGWCSP